MDVQPQAVGTASTGTVLPGVPSGAAATSGAGRSVAAEDDWGGVLSVLVVVALLVVGLRVVGGIASPAAEAVQPYAPRGIAAQPVASADWFALTVRASGFRPNSTVLVEVDGLGQRSMVADAAGVVDTRVELPDRIGVAVRGIAREGGTLELREDVGLVRPSATVRDGLVLVLAAGAIGAIVLAPRIRARLGSARTASMLAAGPSGRGRP